MLVIEFVNKTLTCCGLLLQGLSEIEGVFMGENHIYIHCIDSSGDLFLPHHP